MLYNFSFTNFFGKIYFINKVLKALFNKVMKILVWRDKILEKSSEIYSFDQRNKASLQHKFSNEK